MWNRFEIIDLLTENRNRGIVEIDPNIYPQFYPIQMYKEATLEVTNPKR